MSSSPDYSSQHSTRGVTDLEPSPAEYRSTRARSLGSVHSNVYNPDVNSSDRLGQMLPPPVGGSGNNPLPFKGNTIISPGSEFKGRPAPINVVKANERFDSDTIETHNNGEAPMPSPRAALVAGLRSATDRRHQQRDQQLREHQLQQQQLFLQQQHLLQQKQLQLQQQQQQHMLLLQQQMRMHNLSLNDGFSNVIPNQNIAPLKSPFGFEFNISPPTSPIPTDYSTETSLGDTFLGTADRVDPRVMASMQQKHQELLVNSALIAQQQQRIQAVLKYGAPQYDENSIESPQVPSPSITSRSHLPNHQSHHSMHQFSRHSISHMEPPAPLVYGANGSPSSSSIPARPSSSTALRADLNPGPTNPTLGTSGYRRTHRKAASMSASGSMYGINNSQKYHLYSSPHYSSGSFGAIGGSNFGNNSSQLRSSVPGNSSNMVPSGSRVGGGDYEMPLRQPTGPPPLDELKAAKSSSNFAALSL